MKKRRLSFRLENDEAVVIAPVEWWEAVASFFDEMAGQMPDASEEWTQASEHVQDWVERTRDKRELA